MLKRASEHQKKMIMKINKIKEFYEMQEKQEKKEIKLKYKASKIQMQNDLQNKENEYQRKLIRFNEDKKYFEANKKSELRLIQA